MSKISKVQLLTHISQDLSDKNKETSKVIIEFILESFADVLIKSVGRGDSVSLNGVGTFEPKTRVARKDKGSTESVDKDEINFCDFKMSQGFKRRINS